MKYKYMTFEHGSGSIVRDEEVAVYVPGKDEKRFLTKGIVDSINKNTIRVTYFINDKAYKALLGPRLFCKLN